MAELALAELEEVVELTAKINKLATRIEQRVRETAPTLLAMPGVGPLTAGKIVGEVAGISRFKSEAAFARHTGIAPILVWSPNTAGRDRLTRSGNRQLNAAVHRIAITQIRLDGPGQAYYRNKAEGMTSCEALRCLKRRLVRIVHGHLHTDQRAAAPDLQAAAWHRRDRTTVGHRELRTTVAAHSLPGGQIVQ